MVTISLNNLNGNDNNNTTIKTITDIIITWAVVIIKQVISNK